MTMALVDRLAQATSLSLGASAEALSEYFTVCQAPEPFAEFIESLVATPFWKAKRSAGGDIPRLCCALAGAVDAYYDDAPEPAYHSRRHFKEVCLALSLLLKKGIGPSVWEMADRDCWILLLAAIGHDFGHEGRPNRVSGELEAKSCELVEAAVVALQKDDTGLVAEDLDTIRTLIRATEPTLYAVLTAAVDAPAELRRIDAMKVLLVEADLFASMLPSYGVVLGKLLGQELAPHAPALAQLVASPAGRKGFLESHPYFSPNSHQLAFNDVIRTAIIQTQN